MVRHNKLREVRPRCLELSLIIGLPLKAESVTLPGSILPPVSSAGDLRPSRLEARDAHVVQAWAHGVLAVRPAVPLPKHVRVTLTKKPRGWYTFKEYTPLRTLRHLASLSIRHLMSTVDIWNGNSLKLLCQRPTIELIGLSDRFKRQRAIKEILLPIKIEAEVEPQFNYQDYLDGLEDEGLLDEDDEEYASDDEPI
jgi:hypothetical protein